MPYGDNSADELARHGMYNGMVPAWGTLAALAFGDGANDDLHAVLLRLRTAAGSASPKRLSF